MKVVIKGIAEDIACVLGLCFLWLRSLSVLSKTPRFPTDNEAIIKFDVPKAQTLSSTIVSADELQGNSWTEDGDWPECHFNKLQDSR